MDIDNKRQKLYNEKKGGKAMNKDPFNIGNIGESKSRKVVNFCNLMFFSCINFSKEEIYENVKNFLVENEFIDVYNSKNKNYVEAYILKSFYTYFDIKINSVLNSKKSALDKVYEHFMKYKYIPKIQHEIGKAIYKYELTKGEIFPITIPLSDKANNILQERLRNLDKYSLFMKNLTFEDLNKDINKVYNAKYGKNIGITNKLTVADIRNISKTNKLNQDGHMYVFDKNEVPDLLNIEKHLLCKPIYAFHRGNSIVKSSYYLGKYKNQDILFCERIFYPVDFKGTCSYSFGFFAGGNSKDFVFLTRADYNVEHSHFDKLINGIEPNCERMYQPYDKFDANLKYTIKNVSPTNSYYIIEDNRIQKEKSLQNSGIKIKDPTHVYKAHIHITDDIYSILFPIRANHADAVIIPEKNVFNKSFKDLYNYSKNHNVRDRDDLYDFFNRTSHETIPDFEHLVKLMKNITKTTSNENTICKICDISNNNVNELNNKKCLDETILYDLTNINLSIKTAYNDYLNEKTNEGELIYEN